jgi:uncharacterized membrane protein YphA (DoxX/SURF4 family)
LDHPGSADGGPRRVFSRRNSEAGFSRDSRRRALCQYRDTVPGIDGPFVGTVELVCGALIILGLFTRLAAIPLIVIMVVAIVSTKLPIWAGHDIWIFHMPKLARYGFWSMAHEARDDFLMLLGSIYLLIAGAGAWSLDAMLVREPAAFIASRAVKR